MRSYMHDSQKVCRHSNTDTEKEEFKLTKGRDIKRAGYAGAIPGIVSASVKYSPQMIQAKCSRSSRSLMVITCGQEQQKEEEEM